MNSIKINKKRDEKTTNFAIIAIYSKHLLTFTFQVSKHSFFQDVPDMLNEFKGSRGLMFELQETKKL